MIFLRNLSQIHGEWNSGPNPKLVKVWLHFGRCGGFSANRASSPPEWRAREQPEFSGSREDIPTQSAAESRGAEIRSARPRKWRFRRTSGGSGGIPPRVAPLAKNRPGGRPANTQYCSGISEETSTPTSANSMGTKFRPCCPIRRRFRYPNCFSGSFDFTPLMCGGFVGLFSRALALGVGFVLGCGGFVSPFFARARVGRWVCTRLRRFR